MLPVRTKVGASSIAIFACDKISGKTDGVLRPSKSASSHGLCQEIPRKVVDERVCNKCRTQVRSTTSCGVGIPRAERLVAHPEEEKTGMDSE